MKRKLTCAYHFIILKKKKDFQESTPKIQILMFGLAQASHLGLWDIIPPMSQIAFHMYYVKYENTLTSVGAKLRYMGYFASLLHHPGRKSWLFFFSQGHVWGLRNPCFTKFSVVNFL